MEHSRDVRRLSARLLLAFSLGGLVALIGTRFIPDTTYELGPASLSAGAELGLGSTEVVIPPLGRVTASTHESPLVLDVQLTRVDFASLGRLFSEGSTSSALTDQLEEGLRGLAGALAARLLLGAAIIGALTGALLPRRRWPLVGAAVLGGLSVMTVALTLTAATFDVNAFADARFSGELVRAPQVLEAVNRGVGSLEALRSRYETGAERLTDLLAIVARPNPNPHEGTTAILHVSDMHSNPIGVEVTRQLAREFDVAAVIDTGDVTSFGERLEGRIGSLIGGVGVPYLFIPGNHDSFSNRLSLDRVGNVTLLDETTRDIRGVDILGWADPTFTASNEIDTEEGNELREAEASLVAAEVEATQPDVLAVHDRRLAEESIGSVPLILAGHTHEGDYDDEDGSLILTVGSTGATGLGSFVAETDMAYEAEVLYFRVGVPVAVDYVKFRGAGGDFEVERRTFDPPR